MAKVEKAFKLLTLFVDAGQDMIDAENRVADQFNLNSYQLAALRLRFDSASQGFSYSLV